MRYEYLSHALKDGIPVYRGNGSLDIGTVKSKSNGDATNVFRFRMEDHWGTHLDLPRHFFDDGMSAADYGAGYWIFAKPQIIKLDTRPSEVVSMGKWCDEIKRESDILLLRSGCTSYRGEERYITDCPGLHHEVATLLRRSYPNIRALGIDWLSVSSYNDREMGRLAHKAFLDPAGAGKPIVLIEDMDLSSATHNLAEVYVGPLIVERCGGAPCAVIGGFRD